MFSPRQRTKRPLGHYVPDSRLEEHVEKALFRTNAEILRNMCVRGLNEKQREPHQLPIETTKAAMTPEVRWLLTRSARMQRINDAGFAKFSNHVKDRVVSAGGRRNSTLTSLQRQRSMCFRTRDAVQQTTARTISCDVLGPSFCSECMKINKKNVIAAEHKRNFPRIEVHSRALVAPQRVEKLYLSHPQELFYQEQAYKCGCPVDPGLEITTPLVYSRHEIFERIRRKKHLEMNPTNNDALPEDRLPEISRINTTGSRPEIARINTTGSRPEIARINTTGSRPEIARINTTGGRPEIARINTTGSRPSFYDEKTEPPMNLKVSITYRSDDTG